MSEREGAGGAAGLGARGAGPEGLHTLPRPLDRLLSVQPQLNGVRSAAQALGLEPLELLHAGPALRDPSNPPAVLMSSAAVTCIHEGWASSLEEAEGKVRRGEVRLTPAQPRGCVVPLALVVSAGTPLFEVADGSRRIHAPVSTVRGPDTRMGHRDPTVLQRLATRDSAVAPAWRRALLRNGPLPLLPIAAHGLTHGDDLHSRTSAANAALGQWLRVGASATELADHVDATPLFFLTPWMAACALVLRAAEDGEDATLVTRAGANGERFGIALARSPGCWTCMESMPPAGRLMTGVCADTPVCNAIGDSAVIDLLGCGGQALAQAPEPLGVLDGFVEPDELTLPDRLLATPHPSLGRKVGLDAARVVELQAAPLVLLAMQAADGRGGFIGRGVFRPPVDLFARALEESSRPAR